MKTTRKAGEGRRRAVPHPESFGTRSILRAADRVYSRAESPKKYVVAARSDSAGARPKRFKGAQARYHGAAPPAPKSRRGTLYVGVDIGKDWLVAGAPGFSRRVQNSKEGCLLLLKAARSVSTRVHFVCEATGTYGKVLMSVLHARRCKVSVLMGSKVRQFARATGRFAKTDKIDCRLLSDVGSTLHPVPAAKPAPLLVRLRDIVRRRRQLLRTMAKQKQQDLHISNTALKRATKGVRAAMRQELAILDALVDKVLARDPILSTKWKLFHEVSGVGPLTATYVLAELPEIGRMNRKQVAAMAGLAPYNRESGLSDGPRHIFGGRTHLRSGLFMAAVVASQRNPILSRFYRRLRKRGKPGRVALVAVARKLLIHLNALARKADSAAQEDARTSLLHLSRTPPPFRRRASRKSVNVQRARNCEVSRP